MNIDDTLLMAYVDGELPPARVAEIDEALAHSGELAERIAALRASVLPYQAAFARRAMPGVPDSLTDFVNELARTGVAPTNARADLQALAAGAGASDARKSARQGDADDYAEADTDLVTGDGMEAGTEADAYAASAMGTGPRASGTSGTSGTPGRSGAVGSLGLPRRRDTRQRAVWLAAAFIAGAFFCGAALKFGPRLGEPRVSPWLEAAAGYQELYTRETVSDLPENADANAHLLDEVRRDDHLPIAIPDLRNAGLTFKHIQRLRFKGRPLIQIVYLPEHGDPVALCVIDAKKEQPMKTQRVYGMDVVSWTQDKLAFALIGHGDNVDLAAVHKRLADDPSLVQVE